MGYVHLRTFEVSGGQRSDRACQRRVALLLVWFFGQDRLCSDCPGLQKIRGRETSGARRAITSFLSSATPPRVKGLQAKQCEYTRR